MIDEATAGKILFYFYPEDTPLRRLLLKHSRQVQAKALEIASASKIKDLDAELASVGALLHDVGIKNCHAPGILCNGTLPYIAHGTEGARLLREYGASNGIDLEPFARICERHTGSGLTKDDVVRQNLPIPPKDYLPLTLEEKLVCLADKFYSKSGDMEKKSLASARHSMEKFGSGAVERFEALLKTFRMA